MRMTKKITSIVLAVLMVVSMMSVMAISASAEDAVCILDDTTEYTTVAKACAAITDNNVHTIKLLADSTSTSNIGLYQGSWSNRTGGKNVVLDLNGFTYTQNKTNGTGAFVLAPASDFSEGSSLTVKDTSSAKTGKITSNTIYTTIQCGSMCTFTLESGTIENTGDDGTYTGTALQVSGSGEATLTGGSLVATGDDAVAVYMYEASGNTDPKLNIQGSTITADNGVMTDNCEGTITMTKGTVNADWGFIIYDDSTVSIKGGTVNSDNPAYVDDTTNGSVTVTGGTFTASASDFVDPAYNVEYTNASGKISYKKFSSTLFSSNGTYKLLSDVSTSLRLTPGTLYSNITLDLNGYTLTSTANDNCFLLSRTGSESAHKSFTIKNGTINAKQGVDVLASYSDLTLDNVTLNVTDNFAVCTNGTNTGNNITIKDSDITSNNVAIYKPSNGSLTIEDSNVTGEVAVYVKSGSVSIDGGTFTATGAKADYAYNGSGCNPTGDAIVIDNCNYPGGAPTVTITDGTFISENGEAVASYAGAKAGADVPDVINNFIEGGSFSSDVTPLVVDGKISDDVGAGVAGAPFTITNDTNPLNPVETETVNDGNLFGLDCKYLKGTLLGVQKKADSDDPETSESGQESGNDMRFVAVLDTELLQGADDYGFILGKVDSSRTYADTNINKLVEGAATGVKKISAVGTYNTVCGDDNASMAYGNPEDDSTDYKYVTCAVNGVDDSSKIVARFYYVRGGKTYYAKYAGHNYNYTGCMAGMDDSGEFI